MSPSDSFAIRLKSWRFYAAFLTRFCGYSVWHLWRFSGSSFLPQKKTFLKFFWTLGSFVSFYSLYLPNSYCSRQIYGFCHFSLIFVFDQAFVCYILQHTTCEIKLYLLGKLLQLLTYFAEPFVGYRMEQTFFTVKTWKQVLRIKQKFPVTSFVFVSLKISKNNIYLL